MCGEGVCVRARGANANRGCPAAAPAPPPPHTTHHALPPVVLWCVSLQGPDCGVLLRGVLCRVMRQGCQYPPPSLPGLTPPPPPPSSFSLSPPPPPHRVEHRAPRVRVLRLRGRVPHHHRVRQGVQRQRVVVLPEDGLQQQRQGAQVRLLQQGERQVPPHVTVAAAVAAWGGGRGSEGGGRGG